MEIIGITGSRYGATFAQQRSFVEHITRIVDRIEVHHGCCVGADEAIHNLAWTWDCRIVGHPPTDPRLMFDYDHEEFDEIRQPLPYLQRNEQIVNSSTYLMAFPNMGRADFLAQRRGGTRYTVSFALGQPERRVIVVWPSGQRELFVGANSREV